MTGTRSLESAETPTRRGVIQPPPKALDRILLQGLGLVRGGRDPRAKIGIWNVASTLSHSFLRGLIIINDGGGECRCLVVLVQTGQDSHWRERERRGREERPSTPVPLVNAATFCLEEEGRQWVLRPSSRAGKHRHSEQKIHPVKHMAALVFPKC